jgi:hypothetical protein
VNMRDVILPGEPGRNLAWFKKPFIGLQTRKPHGQIPRGSMSNIATMPSNIATLAMLLLRSKLLLEHGLGRSEGVTLSHCHIAT